MLFHPAYPDRLTRRQFDDEEHLAAAWVDGASAPVDPIVITESDPEWPRRFLAHAETISQALGEVALRIEHVGSTSVPGLPAKPIIDIDVHVADSSAEQHYVPALERIGYRLIIREPWWNGHRMLVTPQTTDRVNLHVFPVDAPEPLRHLLFRDWLRSHPEDRQRYAAAKRDLARSTADSPADYNLAKNDVIDEIFARIFSAPPQQHPSWPDTAGGPLELAEPDPRPPGLRDAGLPPLT